MSEEKKSRNPFINLAAAAKAIETGSRVTPELASQIRASKKKQTGAQARPVKKVTGRGR